jgi:two-component system, NarL family, response regulator DevR
MPHPPHRPEGPLRVVVVDSDERVRASVSGLICISGRIEVVGDAGQVGPAFEIVTATSPDLVMVDPRLPDLEDGLAFIGRLRAAWPEIHILAMSWSDVVEPALLAGGADGFVHKTYRPTELVAAIEAVDRRATERSA